MIRTSVVCVVLLSAVTGCGGGTSSAPQASTPQSSTPALASTPTPTVPTVSRPVFDPAAFVALIDNPFLPLLPGTKLRYRSVTAEGPEDLVVDVTRGTKRILGVQATVVRHTVTRDRQLAEVVLAAYAQDKSGNVWYLGEDVREYENGKVVGTTGSWQAGKDGAQPGVMMEGRPAVGDRYSHENYPGKAMDRAEVLSLTERVRVPAGSFNGVLMTKDFTPLEPEIVDHKYYAPGVGIVLEVTVKGGKERRELVSVSRS